MKFCKMGLNYLCYNNEMNGGMKKIQLFVLHPTIGEGGVPS